jgi:rhodanese-related sulfurtransferase
LAINRRQFWTLSVAGILCAFASPSLAGSVLSAAEAYAQAKSGKIILVDIRTPKEWSETGSATVAKRLDMRRADFMTALDGLLSGDRSKPVALICARGVRSSRLSRALRAASYANVIDVPEGMLGSYAGPGWLERGLPVSR